MWRSVKRAAEAAARSASRGSAASSSRASAPEARASAIARVARDGAKGSGKNATTRGSRESAPVASKPNPSSRGRHDASTRHDRPIHERCVDRRIATSKAKTGTRDQRRRSMHAEGLVRLRLSGSWSWRRRRRGASPARSALEMVGALRRAGVPWFEIAQHRVIREGSRSEQRESGAPSPTRRRRRRRRRRAPPCAWRLRRARRCRRWRCGTRAGPGRTWCRTPRSGSWAGRSTR